MLYFCFWRNWCMYSRYVRRRGKGVHSKYHDLNRKSLGQRKYVTRVFVQGKKKGKIELKIATRICLYSNYTNLWIIVLPYKFISEFITIQNSYYLGLRTQDTASVTGLFRPGKDETFVIGHTSPSQMHRLRCPVIY